MRPPPPRSPLFPYTTLFRSNLFRGESRDIGAPQVFGGQVLGQALSAAAATVEARVVHSLHAYFRSEEHTSNSSHPSISYAVFCLKKKTPTTSAATLPLPRPQ